MQGEFFLSNNNGELLSEESVSLPEQNIPEEPYRIDAPPENDGFSDLFREYLHQFERAVEIESRKPTNPVFVDQIASRVAKLYESLRRIIDWKEEHLLRRSAIERMLKRRFVSHIYGLGVVAGVNPEEAAEPFVKELVRSGHFGNGMISKDNIRDVQYILEKFLYVLENSIISEDIRSDESKKETKSKLKRKINFYNWMLELTSCEIDHLLDPPLREYALMDLMVKSIDERVRIIPNGALSNDEKNLQIFISVRKALFNLDAPMIHFDIVSRIHPEIFDKSIQLPVLSDVMPKIWEEVQEVLRYSKSGEFYAVAEKYDAAYLMIGDAMNAVLKDEKSPREIASLPLEFMTWIEQVYSSRLTTLKKRLYKLAIFSTLSIFVAGSVSLVIFEIPVATLVRGYFSPWAILADLAIPTALMFILVSMIKPPSKENLAVVKDEVTKIAYKVKELDVYEVKVVSKKKEFQSLFFAIVYLAGGMFSLYFIYWIFKLADVPWTSLYIDTINVAMVVFAAMVIKQRANELTILERENFFDFFVEPFSIPLAKIGAWVSDRWKEYNIVSILFSALVDYPFSTFVASLESWRNFIKEKRSGLH